MSVPRDNIVSLLRPQSVAVVGASEAQTRLGGWLMRFITEGFENGGTYTGEIVPINPQRETVFGRRAYPALRDVPVAPELALVMTPPAAVIETVRDAAAIGVRAVIIISAGFAETGPTGAAQQREVTELARSAGIALIGPNCAGAFNVPFGLRASFFNLPGVEIVPGNVAVVSQSGAVGLGLFESLQEAGVGTSYMCTTGNEAGVSTAELIDTLLDFPDVAVIVTYLEGATDVGALAAAGRRSLELGKSVIMIRSGRSPAGQRAAMAHSGAAALGDTQAGLLESSGFVTCDSIHRALDAAAVLSAGRRPGGRRLGILTNSGGVGVLIADAASRCGFDVPVISEAMQAELATLVPSIASVCNPVDPTAQMVNSPGDPDRVLRLLMESDEFDAVCISNLTRQQPDATWDRLGTVAASYTKPLVAHSRHADVVRALNRRGIPAVTDPEGIAHALAAARCGG